MSPRSSTAPPLTEAQFMAQVVVLALMRGWETFHVRAGRTLDSWRTPGSGTMAKGWPDLVLTRARDRRLLFVELKRDSGKTTPEQERVLGVLRAIEHYPTPLDIPLRQKPPIEHPSVQVLILRPADWPFIEALLA